MKRKPRNGIKRALSMFETWLRRRRPKMSRECYNHASDLIEQIKAWMTANAEHRRLLIPMMEMSLRGYEKAARGGRQ